MEERFIVVLVSLIVGHMPDCRRVNPSPDMGEAKMCLRSLQSVLSIGHCAMKCTGEGGERVGGVYLSY